MDSAEDEMINFDMAADNLDIRVRRKKLLSEDTEEEYYNYLNTPDHLYIFHKPQDIKKLLDHDSSRYFNCTGEHIENNLDEIQAVFTWNYLLGIITNFTSSVERWENVLKMKTNSACIICSKIGEYRLVCSTCAAVTCLNCIDKKCNNCKEKLHV